MRILQTADNHIGETAYSRIDSATGLNARGIDFLNSFKNIADIAIRERVDVLLIVGDFFTRTNPHPRYILESIRKLKQVVRAGIRIIIVSGNHETPRIATTLNPLELLSELEGVDVVLEPKTLKVGDYDFVCVPAPPNFDEIKNLFDSLLTKALVGSHSDKKILATHIPLAQATFGSEQTLETFVGDCVSLSQIPRKFEYVALGHIHRFQKIECPGMPIYYTGSTEKCEFNEEHDVKYVELVELGGTAKVTRIEIPTRKMITLVDRDCSGLEGTKITKNTLESIEQQKDQIADAIVRIKLDGIDIDEMRHIDWREIKERLAGYNVFEFKPQATPKLSLPELDDLAGGYILPPSEELKLFVKGKKEYKGKTSLLLRLGNEIIKEVEEEARVEA